MKTSYKHLRAINQNVLVFIAIIITLIGLSLKAEAHTHTDPAKLEKDLVANSMRLQLNNTVLSILIPKIQLEALTSIENPIEGQLVYVTNNEIGFYRYKDNHWSKTNVVAVLRNVQESLEIYAPSVSNIILTEATNKHSNCLDYNGHIEELHKQFGLNESRQNYATIKERD